MTPLLLPSPLLVDRSFPRSQDELNTAAIALGELYRIVSDDTAHLLLTPALQQILETIEWGIAPTPPLLIEIYRLITQLFLQPHEGIHILVNLPSDNYTDHPTPDEGMSGPLIDYWSEDTGKILTAHDKTCEDNTFFIGISCATAFSGESKSQYMPCPTCRCFPIVGPTELSSLGDAFKWETPAGIYDQSVSFTDAKKNLKVIGGTVHTPSGGSHYRVSFPRARSWTLDPNNDPVPETYLGQLTHITALPLNVIKYALMNGKLPPRLFRLLAYEQ